MYKYLSIVFSLMVNLKNFIEKNSKNIQTVVSETKRPMLAPIYPSFGINKKFKIKLTTIPTKVEIKNILSLFKGVNMFSANTLLSEIITTSTAIILRDVIAPKNWEPPKIIIISWDKRYISKEAGNPMESTIDRTVLIK